MKEVENRRVLWDAQSLDIGAITTIANNGSYWMVPGSIITTSTSTVGANYWHKINVRHADSLVLYYQGTVNSVAAGDDTVTICRMRPICLGLPKGLAGASAETFFGSTFPYWLNNSTAYTASESTHWNPYLLYYQPVVNSVYYDATADDWPIKKPSDGGYVTGDGLVLGNGATPVATDTVRWSLECGDIDATKVVSGIPTREISPLNVSRYDEVYIALNIGVTSVENTARIDIDDYDGQLVAITYRDVDLVRKLDSRIPQRGDRVIGATT